MSDTPCLCTLLRRASRAVSRVYDEKLRTAGIRVTQLSILACLDRLGDIRQSDLGAKTYLEETSLTRALKSLLQAGWIQIRPGEDRREKWVSITRAGVAKIKKVRPAWNEAQQQMKESLGTDEWTLLFAVLPTVAIAAAES